MATLVLLMSLATASYGLHLKFHDDASHNHAPCAICTVAKGHVDVPVVHVSEVFAWLSVAWTLPCFQTTQPRAVDFLVAPTRGPPASVSSQS